MFIWLSVKQEHLNIFWLIFVCYLFIYIYICVNVLFIYFLKNNLNLK